MALTRVYGRVVYPHGEGTPTPVTGDGVIEYVHATPGIVDGAVHGPDRKRAEYTDGVAEDAWLKPGMWRAYVYPDQGRSYTLHLGVPETGETTIADAVGEIVPDGIITRGEQGPPGASITGVRDNGDQTVSFTLSDGTETEPVTIQPGPQGEEGPAGPEGPRGPKGDKGDTPTWEDLPGKPVSFPSTIPDVQGLTDRLAALEYDSGWRDVTSLLRPEYTASNPDAYATLRRVGPSVNFNLQQGRNATADGAMAALQVPSGFRVDPAHRTWGSTGIEDNTGLQVTDGAGLYLSGSYVNTHARTGKRYSFSMTWLTSDPIPTNPPGDPA